jgi:hypothetical protein
MSSPSLIGFVGNWQRKFDVKTISGSQSEETQWSCNLLVSPFQDARPWLPLIE